jgi:hypothetical protein
VTAAFVSDERAARKAAGPATRGGAAGRRACGHVPEALARAREGLDTRVLLRRRRRRSGGQKPPVDLAPVRRLGTLAEQLERLGAFERELARRR